MLYVSKLKGKRISN